MVRRSKLFRSARVLAALGVLPWLYGPGYLSTVMAGGGSDGPFGGPAPITGADETPLIEAFLEGFWDWAWDSPYLSGSSGMTMSGGPTSWEVSVWEASATEFDLTPVATGSFVAAAVLPLVSATDEFDDPDSGAAVSVQMTINVAAGVLTGSTGAASSLLAIVKEVVILGDTGEEHREVMFSPYKLADNDAVAIEMAHVLHAAAGYSPPPSSPINGATPYGIDGDLLVRPCDVSLPIEEWSCECLCAAALAAEQAACMVAFALGLFACAASQIVVIIGCHFACTATGAAAPACVTLCCTLAGAELVGCEALVFATFFSCSSKAEADYYRCLATCN